MKKRYLVIEIIFIIVATLLIQGCGVDSVNAYQSKSVIQKI